MEDHSSRFLGFTGLFLRQNSDDAHLVFRYIDMHYTSSYH